MMFLEQFVRRKVK